MRKRVIIGDVHGRFEPVFNILYNERPDDVIILGDYFDSFNIDAYTQRECYDKIIELRNEHILSNRGIFIMLIGNHDMHYISSEFDRCSGWNPMTDSVAGYVLCRDCENGILQISYIDNINKTIYSHAGVSMNWLNKYCAGYLVSINTLGIKCFNFTYREGGDEYGSSSWNSPLWIRPKGLRKSPYKDEQGNIWSQVFGHTESDAPFHWTDGDGEFYNIDCIKRAYLVEMLDDNGKLVSRTIEYVK